MSASRRGILSGLFAVAGASSTALATTSPAPVADGPDAAIIRLCAEHIANFKAYNSSNLEDGSPEHEAQWEAYERTREAINAVRPVTIQGVLAKCRVAQNEALQPCGWEDWEYSIVADWTRDIVKDLIRIGGAA